MAGHNWIGLRQNDDYTVTGVSEMPLLPALAALILLLGAFLAAWRREGR
jgi:LPXTG-motif cell wall-anchored protein